MALPNWEKRYNEINNLKKQKVLWQDNGNYMGENQTAQLSEKVSEQNNGIVLVFTEWDSGKNERKGWGYNTFFVPKSIIPITWNGVGLSFQIFWQNTFRAFKYLYIYDDKIKGNNGNSSTQNGVNNCDQVLIAVIGV